MFSCDDLPSVGLFGECLFMSFAHFLILHVCVCVRTCVISVLGILYLSFVGYVVYKYSSVCSLSFHDPHMDFHRENVFIFGKSNLSNFPFMDCASDIKSKNSLT